MLQSSEAALDLATTMHRVLVDTWVNDGPEQVWEELLDTHPDEVRTLVMAYIGSTAAKV